mmetsp:Transcript_24789/g.32389  ORF Transcript_24789/g.32389 Transcript_24789/m.32389 type:complete len:255 (+) Transcript_24789:168-932(+)
MSFNWFVVIFCVFVSVCHSTKKRELFDPYEAFFEIFGVSNFSSDSNSPNFRNEKVHSASSRKLLGAKSCGIDVDEPCCITCAAMEYCSILTDVTIEEKYVPGDFSSLMSCTNFDDRLARLDIWGPSKSEKTFRDTDTCRDMVLDYTCRFWANMHGNRCDPDTGPQILTPCRSYCSTLATTCAHTLDYLDLCEKIACDTTGETCYIGPDSTEGPCFIYELNSYVDDKAVRATTSTFVVTAFPLLLTVIVYWMPSI